MLIDWETSICKLNSNTSPVEIAQGNQAQKPKKRACSNEGPQSKSEENPQAKKENGDVIHLQQLCDNKTVANEEARKADHFSNHYRTSNHQRKHKYAHENHKRELRGTEENWRNNQRGTTTIVIATTKEHTQPQPKNSTPTMHSSFFFLKIFSSDTMSKLYWIGAEYPSSWVSCALNRQ